MILFISRVSRYYDISIGWFRTLNLEQQIPLPSFHSIRCTFRIGFCICTIHSGYRFVWLRFRFHLVCVLFVSLYFICIFFHFSDYFFFFFLFSSSSSSIVVVCVRLVPLIHLYFCVLCCWFSYKFVLRFHSILFSHFSRPFGPHNFCSLFLLPPAQNERWVTVVALPSST